MQNVTLVGAEDLIEVAYSCQEAVSTMQELKDWTLQDYHSLLLLW